MNFERLLASKANFTEIFTHDLIYPNQSASFIYLSEPNP